MSGANIGHSMIQPPSKLVRDKRCQQIKQSRGSDKKILVNFLVLVRFIGFPWLFYLSAELLQLNRERNLTLTGSEQER